LEFPLLQLESVASLLLLCSSENSLALPALYPATGSSTQQEELSLTQAEQNPAL